MLSLHYQSIKRSSLTKIYVRPIIILITLLVAGKLPNHQRNKNYPKSYTISNPAKFIKSIKIKKGKPSKNNGYN